MGFEIVCDTLKRTFLDPFTFWRRNIVYIGIFLGVFGFHMINTVSSYDLGASGYGTIFSYFAPALLISGFIYWPLLYMGFSSVDSVRWRASLFAIQCISIVVFLNAPEQPVVRGIISGILLAPFWCSQHISMVQNTSKENRGFEVSVNILFSLSGAVLSAATGAYFLAQGQAKTAVVIALTAMLLGTLCMLFSSKIVRQNPIAVFIKESRMIVHDNPYMARRIVSQSVFEVANFTLAALMHIKGISPAIMATILVPRLVLMFFLSPFVGTMSHKHRKHAFSLGLGFIGLAWVILALGSDYALAFFVASVCYSIGMVFADSSLSTGLYEMQSYASMMWSEVFLASGRALGLLLIVPLLYYDPTIYLSVLALVALTVFFLNKRWQSRWVDAKEM